MIPASRREKNDCFQQKYQPLNVGVKTTFGIHNFVLFLHGARSGSTTVDMDIINGNCQVSQGCNIYFWTCIVGHELFMSPQWCKRDVMFGNSHWSCCSKGRNVWHSEVMLWNYHGRCYTWGTIRETCNKLPRQQLVQNTNGRLLYPWRNASGMQLTPSPGVILLSCIFVECTAGGCSSTGSACIFG